jgi:hypothetical protein
MFIIQMVLNLLWRLISKAFHESSQVVKPMCTVFLIRQVKILREPPGQPPSACLAIAQTNFEKSWQYNLLTSYMYTCGKTY